MISTSCRNPRARRRRTSCAPPATRSPRSAPTSATHRSSRPPARRRDAGCAQRTIRRALTSRCRRRPRASRSASTGDTPAPISAEVRERLARRNPITGRPADGPSQSSRRRAPTSVASPSPRRCASRTCLPAGRQGVVFEWRDRDDELDDETDRGDHRRADARTHKAAARRMERSRPRSQPVENARPPTGDEGLTDEATDR